MNQKERNQFSREMSKVCLMLSQLEGATKKQKTKFEKQAQIFQNLAKIKSKEAKKWERNLHLKK